MPNLYVNDDGNWVTPTQLFIKDSGQWKAANQVYKKQDDTWTLVHENDRKEWLLIIGDNTDIFRNSSSYLSLNIDSNGDYIVCGVRYINAAVTTAIYVTKLTKLGKVVWEKAFNGASTDDVANRIEGVNLDDSDNIFIAGSVNRSGVYNTSGFLTKLNSSGEKQWQTRWAYPNDSNGSDYAYDVNFNGSGDAVMGGYADYPRPYPPGGIQRGSSYTFASSDGTRNNGHAFNGGPSGLSSLRFGEVAKLGTHFYMQTSEGVTFTPNVGQRGYSAIIKTGLGADSLVGIKNTYIGSNSNLWRFRGIKSNGTNLLASAQRSSSNTQTYFVLNDGLSYVAGWTITDSTTGATTDFPKARTYVYDGDYCYAVIESTEEVTHFIKFDVTDGSIEWQNKMVGDSSNKTSDGNPEGVLRLDSSDGGHLVYLSKTDESVIGSTQNVLILWRVPSDGSGQGTYGNYTYSTSTNIAISSQGDTGGSNPNVSFSSAGPTDYGDPGVGVTSVDFNSSRTNFRA